jgi:hypothetical protein
METADKEFRTIRATPLWLLVIQYGVIGLVSAPLFKELENTHINLLRLSILIILSVLLLVAMVLIDKHYYRTRMSLGLFLKNDKFIYSPNRCLTLEVDWKNVEGIKQKSTGVTNYVIPVLKDINEMRILKTGWFGRRWITGNKKQHGMPIVIIPYTLNTSVFALYDEFNKHL